MCWIRQTFAAPFSAYEATVRFFRVCHQCQKREARYFSQSRSDKSKLGNVIMYDECEKSTLLADVRSRTLGQESVAPVLGSSYRSTVIQYRADTLAASIGSISKIRYLVMARRGVDGKILYGLIVQLRERATRCIYPSHSHFRSYTSLSLSLSVRPARNARTHVYILPLALLSHSRYARESRRTRGKSRQ